MKARQHGTYRRYFVDKCRCDLCREAQRARVAQNRADRLVSGRLNHGTRSAYDAGCRCLPCTVHRMTVTRTVDVRSAAHRAAKGGTQ